MSRLDSFIRRMQAQRDCLNHIAPKVRGMDGPILEIGLGNGRTYDHLRELFPGRTIYVFDRHIASHPDCIPPPELMFLGDVGETMPMAERRLGRNAVLIHSDLGTGDQAANGALGKWLGPAIDTLLAKGGIVLANQPLSVAGWQRLPDPPGVSHDRYFIYQRG